MSPVDRYGLAPSIVVVALLFPPFARAIDPGRTMSQYVRERWGVEQGFPSGPVYAIDQTRDGYLWVGTEKGLIRFDGYSFHLMQSGAPAQASLSHVLGLFAHQDGSLWLRLRRPGLTLLRYRDGIFEDVLGDLATRASAAAIARGRAGGPLLWLLQREGASVHGDGLETLASGVEYSGSPVLALAQSANGDIWVGTRDAGLLRIREGRATQITEGLPDLKVNALAPFGEDELWIGTDNGVARWDGKRVTRRGVPESLNGVHALAMLVDRDSNLWIGASSRGLARLSSSGVGWMEPSVGRAGEAVTSLFEDREGNIWVGSARGLERIRDSVFVTYSAAEGLPADGAGPVYVDAVGSTWLAPLAGGLWRLRDGHREQVMDAGLGDDIVYSIAAAKDGLWIGRQRGGLTHLELDGDKLSAHTYDEGDGLGQNSVYAVHESRDGSVWAGTLSGGASRLQHGQFTVYTSADGLATNTVASILESADGAMWFATPSGLSAFSNGEWRSYRLADGLPSDDINCLLEDSKATLWIGTASGLAVRDGDKFYSPAGLPAALRGPILGLAEDGDGSLWVAAANHLVRVNREKLLAGEASDGLREFGVADGLRGVEGVKRHQSVVADSSGRIWFSTNGGISVVNPSRLAAFSAPAIAHVETIAADGRPIDARTPVVIPGGSRRVTFGYTGLSLAVPERVRFRYRLDGFDSAWSEPVVTREAVYTNLSPGSYRFRVVSSNADGVWSPAEGTIPFDVAPLAWQTGWFRLASAAALGIALAGAYRFRMHRLTRQLNLRFEERLAERTRVAQELHDTLLQGFLSASMQLHVAAERLPEESPAKQPLNRVLSLMAQVTDEGRKAVQGLRSSEGESLDLEQAFSHILDELSIREDVIYRVITSGRPKPLHPVLRDEVYRIGREAVANALRHSDAKTIEVEVEYAARNLRVLVRDDGRGISPDVLQSGRAGHWGLTGMRERAERVGGRLSVWSKISQGTEVELSIPGKLAFRPSAGDRTGNWLSRWLPRRPPEEGSRP